MEGERMKLKRGAITILASDERITIEVHDREASLSILDIEMTPEQFCAAIGRAAYTKCEITTGDLSKVGKKHENKNHKFKIPESLDEYSPDKDELHKEAIRTCPKGWAPDKYYGSQSSFVYEKGERYANVTIRRWV